MNRLRSIRDEDGLSLVELLVAMAIGMIVLAGVFTVVLAGTRSANRTTARVIANQSARPVLSRIIDELHSSCISPDLAPIQQGSTPTSITFIYSTDRGVTPVPSKRTISLNTTTGVLTESVYSYLSGSAPSWNFNATPTTTTLLKSVDQPTVAGNLAPVFSYYAYGSDGLISPTPLASTNLTLLEAASVAQVDVTFRMTPPRTTSNIDTGAPTILSDSALLRFTPASTTAGENTPCS
jgi:hypothetical protein